MTDIAFINTEKNKSISHQEIMSQLNPSMLLLFGVSATDVDLPFEIPYFQIQNFQARKYMLSPSFDALQNDMVVKKQLWISLQKLFNIKK